MYGGGDGDGEMGMYGGESMARVVCVHEVMKVDSCENCM